MLMATIILLATLIGVLLFSWLTRPKNPGVAFYRIPASIETALIQQASNPEITGRHAFSIIRLDDSQPLQPQLTENKNRISLLFAPIGQATASLSAKVHEPSEQIRRLLPTTIRNSGTSGRTYYALPVLLDHFELACSKTILERNNSTAPETMEQMLQTARAVKNPKTWPLICAGARDEDLVLLTGSLVHSLHGLEAYEQLVQHIRAAHSFETLLAETPLRAVLETLLSWRRERLLHPQWLEMTNGDIEAFMRFDNAAFVFMPLSTRRTLDPAVAENYEASRFPNGRTASSYPLTAVTYGGIRIRNELFADAAELFLYALVAEDVQQTLSRETGFAPVNAKAPVHDKQAYDVRYWGAASRVLVPDPVTAAIDDPARIASFAEEIRSYIRSGGKPLNQ